MASRSKRRRTRDHSSIANVNTLRPSSVSPFTRSVSLLELEDRRFYNPANDSFPAGFSRTPHLVDPNVNLGRSTAAGRSFRSPFMVAKPVRPMFQAFDQPEHVVTCVRRKSRREVLFAKRKMRGGRGGKWNINSYIFCR